MALEKEIKKSSKTPYFFLDYKPDILDDYFFLDKLNEPVKSSHVNKLLQWAMGMILGISWVPFALALKEFSTNAQSLTWIFLFGFWLVLIYMTFTLKGRTGQTIGILNLLQVCFSVVIGLNFVVFSWLIAVGVMATGSTIWIVLTFK